MLIKRCRLIKNMQNIYYFAFPYNNYNSIFLRFLSVTQGEIHNKECTGFSNTFFYEKIQIFILLISNTMPNKNVHPYRNANEGCLCVFIENKRGR